MTGVNSIMGSSSMPVCFCLLIQVKRTSVFEPRSSSFSLMSKIAGRKQFANLKPEEVLSHSSFFIRSSHNGLTGYRYGFCNFSFNFFHFLFLNSLKLFFSIRIIQGSPLHKPYWLPWATFASLMFLNLLLLYLCVRGRINKLKLTTTFKLAQLKTETGLF